MRVESHRWPASASALEEWQTELAAVDAPAWPLPLGPIVAAGVALVSIRGAEYPGCAGAAAFASAVLLEIGETPPREIAAVAVRGIYRAPYEPGHLALREGPLLEAAVRALPQLPEVLFVHAAGRDHPRRAGLALMLGAALDLPSLGITSRPLVSTGEPPADEASARAPLVRGREAVGYWIRMRAGVRPIVVHAGWRTSPQIAAALTLRASRGLRYPEPIRRALELARRARAAAHDRADG